MRIKLRGVRLELYPLSGNAGTTVTVALTGTTLTGATALTASGTGITATIVTNSSTQITASGPACGSLKVRWERSSNLRTEPSDRSLLL